MSHTTEIGSIVFTDIAALEAAVKDLNAAGVRCSLVKNAVPRAFYQDQQGMGKADYVLKLDNCRFDVGFYHDEAKKGYVARTDLWGGHISAVLGAQAKEGEDTTQAAMGKLYQAYGVQAVTRQAARQGYSVRKVVKPDGTISLSVTGMK